MSETTDYIGLIGKVKPINNETFPLVDAEDVLMPDGTRLSEFTGGSSGGGGSTITVDSELSETSENPVQNKVIANELRYLEEGIDARLDALEQNGTGGEGEPGATFTPTVSEDGVLSWTNDGGLENPEPVSIKGPKGDNGVPATHSWDGTMLTITSASGTSSANLQGENGADGQTPYIKDGNWWIGNTDTGVKAEGVDGTNGTDGIDGTNGTDGVDGADGKSAYETAKEGGYTGTEAQFAKKLAETPYQVSVKEYGAKGNGSTNDTAAFKNALADNRVVYVPGGIYVLSDTLIIKQNSTLELAQDAVLKFTQKDKNCITLLQSSYLKGNHATIFVPYDFGTDSSGNKIGKPYSFKTGASGDDFVGAVSVINMSTADDVANIPDVFNQEAYDKQDWPNLHTPDGVIGESDNATAVPPFTKWDPQWKMGRYITDINICKPDSRGFNYSYGAGYSGYAYATYGKAINIECTKTDILNFMWGVTMSGIRIAGAFDIGIHIHNEEKYDENGKDVSAWNHELRIEAIIERTERAAVVEKTNNAFLDVTYQPGPALSSNSVSSKYAKQGIVLRRCNNINLTGSYVWDWDDRNVLDYNNVDPNNENRYLVMYGPCPGLVMSDAHYNYSSSMDIRNNFYTDYQKNLETMTILQEPLTRWFKPIDGKPYFYDGFSEHPLVLQDKLDDYFNIQTVDGFNNVLSTATDEEGNIFGEKGYIPGRFVSLGDGTDVATDLDSATYYRVTGFISCKTGDKFYMRHLSFASKNGYAGAVLYNQNHSRITSVTAGHFVDHTGEWAVTDYIETDIGCSFAIINQPDTAYVRFVFRSSDVGGLPAIAINESLQGIEYGFLVDNIKVDDDNIESAKLNTLQTRVNNMEQNVAESIDGLEIRVDEKLSNLSIKAEQTSFITEAKGSYVTVLDCNMVDIEYEANALYPVLDAGEAPRTETVASGLTIKPLDVALALGDVIQIRGIDFSKAPYTTKSYPTLILSINRVSGLLVAYTNMSGAIYNGRDYSSNGDFVFEWDDKTKTLKMTLTKTMWGDGEDWTKSHNITYAFSGPLATATLENGETYTYTPDAVIITHNDEIKYKEVWQGDPRLLTDDIWIKAENVYGLDIPTDDDINALIDARLNTIPYASEVEF